MKKGGLAVYQSTKTKCEVTKSNLDFKMSLNGGFSTQICRACHRRGYDFELNIIVKSVDVEDAQREDFARIRDNVERNCCLVANVEENHMNIVRLLMRIDGEN